MASSAPITLSTYDHAALSLKLAQVLPLPPSRADHWHQLQEELRRAVVRPANLIAATTVRIGSRFTVCDLSNRDEETYALVWPEQADVSNRRLSVFTPLGTAVIGYSQGDEITWNMPRGVRRLKLTAVHAPTAGAAVSIAP